MRRARVADAEAIARVQVRSWRSAYRGMLAEEMLAALDEGERTRAWRSYTLDPAQEIRVAERGGEVVGFCALLEARDPDASPGTAEVAALYVDPDHAWAGHGTALLEAAVATASGRGSGVVTLWVLTANAPARRFYEARGFAPDGAARVERKRGFALDEVRYARRL